MGGVDAVRNLQEQEGVNVLLPTAISTGKGSQAEQLMYSLANVTQDE